eukprot:Tamp_31130.p2 GENE.Tamp_31130~~Tamp_31130.p2  ORF type:complete len:152 (-),score=40.97 Tamp_31130:97-552(-)
MAPSIIMNVGAPALRRAAEARCCSCPCGPEQGNHAEIFRARRARARSPVTSIGLQATSRTILLKAITTNTTKALKTVEPNFTVTMQSNDSVIVNGKFVPAAVVTVISDTKLGADSMLEMQAGVAAAFRQGFPIETKNIKFAFLENSANSSD